jgi:hypothetical protein
MIEQHTFTIPWWIPDAQWEKAKLALGTQEAGSSYDRRGLGRYYLLYGDVDFVYDGAHFYGGTYGANGINISLFDLAVTLADAYLNQGFAPGASTKYDQLDDDLQIHFSGEDEVVRMAASDRSGVLLVPRAAFQEGVLAFLCGMAGAIEHRLREALEWESLAALREVAARFCAN